MKKSITMLLALVLAVGMTLTGTVAYLTSTDSDVNVMTLGNVEIEQIEQERGENDTYVEFEQDKPLYPAVGELDNDGLHPNGVDKFVSVKNTGSSDAYVRTLFAFELGSATEAEFAQWIHYITNSTDWTWGTAVPAVIDGNNYMVVEAVYAANNGVLEAGETTAHSLKQVWMDKVCDNEQITALDGNGNGSYTILVKSQAVQTAGFADAKTALEEAFSKFDAKYAAEVFGGMGFDSVGEDESVDASEELEAALNADKENIYISLKQDVTLDILARETLAVGGPSTKTITIDGNGNQLTFNSKDSDWDNISTKNNAKLVLKDIVLDCSGYDSEGGTWNAYDLLFACDVEMIDVTVNHAIALEKNATLKNVTVTDNSTSAAYAIWISERGQTVTIDGLKLDSTAGVDGRGIKIDPQYVASPAKVTLNVSNASFKTESKAAILVKTTVGADITLNNVDISGVAKDTANPVWVDEDTAAYADLVTVTGGNKIVES